MIILAQEVDASLVVIDERMARRYARRLGLPLTGTLGVLLRAKHRGLIPAVMPLVARLIQGGIHVGDALVAEVSRLADEI